MAQAQTAFDAGRYERAAKYYRQALSIDPDNWTAAQGMKLSERIQHEQAAPATTTKAQEGPDFIEKPRGRIQITQEFIAPLREVRQYISWGSEHELADDEIKATLYNKLRQIMIPKVAFQQARLADVVGYLRGESVRLDMNPELISPGIDLTLQRQAAEATSIPSPAGPAEPLISMSGDNVRLLDVLNAITSATNWKLQVGPRGVMLIEPLANHAEWMTEEFRVPPELADLIRRHDPPVAPDSAGQAASVSPAVVSYPTAKAYLEDQGITFNPGTTAVYLAATCKLVVRNTPENVALAENLVERAWDRSASPRPSIKLNHEPELLFPTPQRNR